MLENEITTDLQTPLLPNDESDCEVSKSVESLTLISNNDSSSFEECFDERVTRSSTSLSDALEDVLETTWRERWVRNLSLLSMEVGALSLIYSFFVGQTAVQTVANIGAIFTPTISIKNEKELTNIGKMQEINERMDRENERMKAENERLRATLEQLDGTTGKFEDGLNTLVFITKKQDFNVDQFEKQVKDQKAVLKTMQKQISNRMFQAVLSEIIRCDRNGDFEIEINELDHLMARFDLIPWLVVNKPLFRDMVIKQNGSLLSVLNICRNLLDQDKFLPEEERLFYINEDSYY